MGAPDAADFRGSTEELRAVLAAALPWEAQLTADLGWEPPTPLDTVAVPPFPVDALPPVLRHYVLELARVHKVPVDLPALLAIGAVNAAAARRVEVAIGNTHREAVNLYSAVVMASGERKGPPLRAILAPFQAVERELQREARPAIAAAEERRRLADERLKHLRSLAAKARTAEEREQAASEAEALAQALPSVPVLPKVVVSNTTPEKLEEHLAHQGGAILMASEEAGAVFEIAAGRYANDGGAQLDTLLVAYDGGKIDTSRITRVAVEVERPALSILQTPQPVILRSFREHPEFHHRGLLPRFAFAVPPSLVGTRDYNPSEKIDSGARDAYELAIRRLLALPRPAAAEVPVLHIEGPALAVWRKYHDDVERALADGERLAGIREWGSKQAGRVARIAGGFHLVTVTRVKPWEESPAAATVESACRVGAYLEAHALAAYELMGADPRLDGARTVLSWIERAGLHAFTKRSAFTALRSRFPRVEDLEPALACLEVHGYVRRRDTPRPADAAPQGRRPSPTYEVNPAGHNAHNAQKDSRAPLSAYSAVSAERGPAPGDGGDWEDVA